MSDAVAYDTMRTLLNEVTASLLAVARSADDGTSVRQEIVDLRRAAHAVDGFDRPALDAFAAHLKTYRAQGSV